jgi:hypothetical protein
MRNYAAQIRTFSLACAIFRVHAPVMPTKRKQRLKPTDPKKAKKLLDELRDCLLDARDGTNALWRVKNAIRGIAANEAHVIGSPELKDTG